MRTYCDHRPFEVISRKTVILIDDGVATGATLKAAIQALRALHVEKLVVAVPVGDPTVCKTLSALSDDFICPLQPQQLEAVGSWYDDFAQTEDEEVCRLLALARA
jgi:predicted phosphoribosyltransferase